MILKRIFTCIVSIAMLISLCACVDSAVNNSTVADIFNPTTEGSQVTPTQATETTGPSGESIYTEKLTKYSSGFKILGKKDAIGSFVSYDGEDCCVQYSTCVRGNVTQYGIGVLLFVDGKPQPYKVAANGSYAYMHIFYPPDGEEYTAELLFTPVSGQQGDTLGFRLFAEFYPSYSKYGDVQASVSSLFGRSDVGIGGRIFMNATPETISMPQMKDRVISSSVQFIELTAAEIGGLTYEELRETVVFNMYVNGMQTTRIHNYRPVDGKMTLTMEVYGSPYLQYGVVFFLDHQPVLLKPEDMALFDVQNGKKAVVTVEVDLSDFDGECYVYAMLIPRNSFDMSVKVPFSCIATECVQILG